MNAQEEDVLKAGTNFLASLYGSAQVSDLNSLRYQVFSKKKDPPKIKTLPPTNASAAEHIRYAHLQTLIWYAADQMGPPDVDISKYGWKLDAHNVPQPVYGPTAVAPASLLKVVACTCKSDNPCATNRCSCRAAGLSCTSYCKCDVDTNCVNEEKRTPTPPEDDSDVE